MAGGIFLLPNLKTFRPHARPPPPPSDPCPEIIRHCGGQWNSGRSDASVLALVRSRVVLVFCDPLPLVSSPFTFPTPPFTFPDQPFTFPILPKQPRQMSHRSGVKLEGYWTSWDPLRLVRSGGWLGWRSRRPPRDHSRFQLHHSRLQPKHSRFQPQPDKPPFGNEARGFPDLLERSKTCQHRWLA